MAVAVGLECSEEEGQTFWHMPLQGTHSIYPTFMKGSGTVGGVQMWGPDRRSSVGSIIY